MLVEPMYVEAEQDIVPDAWVILEYGVLFEGDLNEIKE